MLQGISYNLVHPEAMMYTIATALFYPILLLLAGALLYMVFELGRFTLEMARRDRKRSLGRIKSAALSARISIEARNPAQAVTDLGGISDNWLIRQFIKPLGSGADLSPERLAKQLVETEMLATKRLDRTRLWIRLGPIIGLITTLIPISPALVALAKGDLEVLSANLVIAFSTTVIALFVSGMAFVISLYRERAYLEDIGDIEYALELVEE
jgi:biopolymer transport protein ExbB/TolQ